jgi:hypothetical protein
MTTQKMIEWEIELASPEAFVTISAPEDAKDDQLLALACDELTRKTYIWSKKRTKQPNIPSSATPQAGLEPRKRNGGEQ